MSLASQGSSATFAMMGSSFGAFDKSGLDLGASIFATSLALARADRALRFAWSRAM